MNNKSNISNKDHSMSFVISCCKKDIYFTRICVSSIRHFYPNIDIYIIKDKIFGDFPTWDLEKYFGVKELIFSKQKFGWGTAKLFFVTTKNIKLNRCLLLDSDTVITGKILDLFQKPILDKSDIIIHPENPDVDTPEFKIVFTPINWAKKNFQNYDYPGYTFDTGCIVIKPGIIKPVDLKPYFHFDKYPYWSKKYRKYFPCVDQSILNVLIPIASSQNKLKLNFQKYIIWSQNRELELIKLKDIINGKHKLIIHWAGQARGPSLAKYSYSDTIEKLKRSDILNYFQKTYYKQIPFGIFLYLIRYFRFHPITIKLKDYFHQIITKLS